MAWPTTQTTADFVAAVAARSTSVNTYVAVPYVPTGGAPTRNGSFSITKNGAVFCEVLYYNLVSGAYRAATDANPIGATVMIFSNGGGTKAVADAADFLNTLK